MAELQFPDLVGRFQQGIQFGQQQQDRRNQSRLSELARAAYSAPDTESRDINVGEAIGVDPQAGFALQGQLQGIQDRKRNALIQSAAFLGRLPPDQQQSAYTGLRGRLSQEFPDLQLPEAWEQAAPTVAAINQTYGGQQADVKVVGNALVDSSGRVVYQAPQRFQTEQGLIEVGPGGAREITLGGPQQFTTQETGGRQVSIGADVDPATRAAILANPDAFGAAPDMGSIQLLPQGAPSGRILPTGAGARAEQLRLAQEANARAAEAAQRAAAADARARAEADIRQRFGTIPAGFRVNAAGTALEAVPGGPKPAGAAATEDERKAAGWYNQARRAVDNLEAAIKADPTSDTPGFAESYIGAVLPQRFEAEAEARLRSPERQRYVNAIGSASEAILRAATGAGVNENEARQKIAELTPQRGESQAVRDQKLAGLRGYLDDLRTRAGRALPQVREVTTQAEYDALPSGAIYTEDGQQYRKP